MTTNKNTIVVLAGGVGAAKFLEGLIRIVPQEDITVISNTGDDKEFYGLHVSPDIDIVLYTLAGLIEEKQGWGRKNDTYTVMQELTRLGNADWFLLGDKDLAMHIHRTNLLKQGKTLSVITNMMRKKLQLKLTLLPMSDDPVPTFITTPIGTFHFEEYFVKQRFTDPVLKVTFKGSKQAKPAPGVLEAIRNAKSIIIAPSNPIVSIGTILAIPGIKEAIQKSKATKIAVSPIINGMPVKGPADKLMHAFKLPVSPVGIAQWYEGLIDGVVIDQQDALLQTEIEKRGLLVLVTNTFMKDLKTKKQLAKETLRFANYE